MDIEAYLSRMNYHGQREEYPVADEDDFAARLREHFGIVLDAPFREREG